MKLYSKDAVEILEKYNSFAISPSVKESLADRFTDIILPLESSNAALKAELAAEQKKVGEYIREGRALFEFEERQRAEISKLKAELDRVSANRDYWNSVGSKALVMYKNFSFLADKWELTASRYREALERIILIGTVHQSASQPLCVYHSPECCVAQEALKEAE